MQKLLNLKNQKLIADNKKARYNYFIEEEVECGIVLEGSEVKSMRNGKVSILESYANIELFTPEIANKVSLDMEVVSNSIEYAEQETAKIVALIH